MLRPRIIPILLLQDKGLVKGEAFKNHQYIGDPINAVKIFNESYADEISIIDISCGITGKEPEFSLIKEIASEAFMPLSYGGGLKNIEQVRKILHSGVEKVIFNSSAFFNPELIEQTAKEFGSSSTVVSIDVKHTGLFGSKKVVVNNGKKSTKSEAVEYAKRMETLGAGEIILTSVDHEGLRKGYDLSLIKQVANAIKIPLIANGGAGNFDHFRQAFVAGASAVAAGSLFVYIGNTKGILVNYPSEEQINSIVEN
jgi:cyclase